MSVYVRKVRPEPKKPHLVTDENRQRAFIRGAYARNCLQCGTGYNYHPAAKDKGHEHKRGLFCSWDCKSQHIKDSKPGPSSVVYAGYCEACGGPFVCKTKRKYCGKECWPKATVPTYLERPAFIKNCKVCDTRYEVRSSGGMPSQFCSDECRSKMRASHRRIAGAASKAKRRAATIEKVDPFVVFDRDGWKCQICGIDTPRELRGSHKNNAPELDHVIPIAKDGKHSYANTQCCCRKCNIKKSDKILPNISADNNSTLKVA